MAVRELKRTGMDRKLEAKLRNGIAAELKRPDASGHPAAAPTVILEKGGAPDRYLHWYVVWDLFEGVGNEDRCRIIMDAIEEVRGRQEVLRTSIVMGLTPNDPMAKELLSD